MSMFCHQCQETAKNTGCTVQGVCGKNEDILAKAMSGAGGWLEIKDKDERSLKATVQYGLKGISAYAEHAYQLGKHSQPIFEFLMEGLAALVDPSQTQDSLLGLVLKTGQMGVETMALLDKANTDGYGAPQMTTANIGVGKNPGSMVDAENGN